MILRIFQKLNKYKMLTIMLLTTIMGCAAVNLINIRDSQYIDSAFDIYIDRFAYLSDNKIDTTKVGIVFVKELTGNTVGICSRYGEIRFITISREFWNKANEAERECLIFHELGHCLLDRKHCEYKDNEEPISIMFPSIIPKNVYEKNKKKYIKELFEEDNRCNQ